MKITYWTNFSKRKNSTKRPTSGTDVDVYLKDSTSYLNPVFEVNTIPDNVNYIYVADFGRYYYAKVRREDSRLFIDCEVDPLATYKSNIGATSALVEFTSSSSEITITDPRNKPKHNFHEVKTALFDLGSYGFTTTGCFVLAIAGGTGGVTYYVMSSASLEDFYNKVLDDTFWTSITNNMFHLDDAVLSCRWLPYTPAGTYEANIHICGQPTYASGYKIDSRLATLPETAYSFYTYADSLGLGTNYLDFAPFSTGILYLPYVGSVPLDMGVFGKAKSITIKVAIDNYTGDIVYKLSNESGDFISSYQGNCSITVPLSSKSANVLGATSSGVSLIGGIAATVAAIGTKGGSAAIAAGLGTTAASAAALAQSLSVHTQVNGSVSSAVSTELSTKIIATVLTREPTETTLTSFKTLLGMPYFKVATISSLSGYIQCSDASVDMAGYSEEKDAVNNYLNSGFYYE